MSRPVPVKAGPRWFEGWLMVYNSTPAARFHLSKFEAVSAINLCMHWHCVPCPQYPVYIIIIIPPTLVLLWTKQQMKWRLIYPVLFLVLFRPSPPQDTILYLWSEQIWSTLCVWFIGDGETILFTPSKLSVESSGFLFILRIKIVLLDVEAAMKAMKVLIPV